ncbi:MAG TPA: hypothetical protein VJ963_04085, partial [Bacteroidales bacterium]|nr:hypothetical protein [Bacteroidales bacterium]
LVHSATERPLIKGLDIESVLTFIENKLAERESWYEQADITIDGFDTDVGSLHKLIKSRLNIS